MQLREILHISCKHTKRILLVRCSLSRQKCRSLLFLCHLHSANLVREFSLACRFRSVSERQEAGTEVLTGATFHAKPIRPPVLGAMGNLKV